MDLGVTMGISLRFKAAQPYFWREKKKKKKRIRKTVVQEQAPRSGPAPGDAVPAGLLEAGLGRWAGAGLSLHLGSALWRVLFQGLSSSPGEDRHPGRHCPRDAYSTACQHFRGHSEAPAVAAAAPGRRAGLPQLTPRAAACASPHVGGVCGCAGVCECGRGRRPSELLHPSVLLGTH